MTMAIVTSTPAVIFRLELALQTRLMCVRFWGCPEETALPQWWQNLACGQSLPPHLTHAVPLVWLFLIIVVHASSYKIASINALFEKILNYKLMLA